MNKGASGVECPECFGPSRVIRTKDRGDVVKRKRLCKQCHHVFLTGEDHVEKSHSGRNCPKCSARSSVLQTHNYGFFIRRERVCQDSNCLEVFRTAETKHYSFEEQEDEHVPAG